MLATIALLLALGLDTFAVALGLGLKKLPRAQWVRVGLTFALFEGLMPAVGLLIGRALSGALGHIMSYVAGAILVALGLWEVREAMEEEDEQDDTATPDAVLPKGGHAPWLLGLSVSLDEFAVGFSLGLLHVPVAFALAYVAGQAFAVTFLGLALGARVGKKLQERAELVAGLLFIALGVGIVVATWAGLEAM